eukprot:5498380-Amphidinium_carterae.2
MTRMKLKDGNVRSQLYGAYAKQGAGITDVTWKDRDLVQAVHELIRVSNPEVQSYTSIVINHMSVGGMIVVHRDKTNLPGTYVWTTSLGSYGGVGGRLWQFDTQGNVPPPSVACDMLPPHAK